MVANTTKMLMVERGIRADGELIAVLSNSVLRLGRVEIGETSEKLDLENVPSN